MSLLAIDVGSQSIRAILFDVQGRELIKSQQRFRAFHSPQPGWAEEEPEYFWQTLTQVVRELAKQIDGNELRGLALTCQRSSVVCLDRNGKPLRPAILWMDQRRSEPDSGMGFWSPLFSLIGQKSTLNYLRAEAEANWIRQHQPDVWQRIDKYLFLSGYLNWKLTGHFCDSVASQVGYIPFNYRQQRWASSWDWKWRAVPVQRTWLPELVPSAGQLGGLSAEAAEQLGLPKDLPVFASAADKACEVLGSGVVNPDTASLSFGTTATVNVIEDRYQEAVRFLPPYPAAQTGRFNMEVMVYRGFWMVQWFIEQFGLDLSQLEALLHQSEPGADGLMLQPYWSPGLKFPGPEARGAVIGFAEHHDKADLYRAVIEGLAFGLKHGLERIEQKTGQPIQRLLVSGGGSQSDGAMQITADVFGLPTGRIHTHETSALGAAIHVAVGSSLYPDYQSAVQKMVHEGDWFTPNFQHHKKYQYLFQQVYLKMYRQLKPLYKTLYRMD